MGEKNTMLDKDDNRKDWFQDDPPVIDARDERAFTEEAMDRELTFHYSRERRLERACAAVKAINDPTPPKKRRIFGPFGGVIGALTSTRSNTMMLIVIVGVLIAVSFITRFSRDMGQITFEGNGISYVAVNQRGGGSILTIRKNLSRNAEEFYTGAVSVVVMPARTNEFAEDRVITERIFFTPDRSEEFRIEVPFDASTLLVHLYAEESPALVNFRVIPRR
jgi:hypothetical protein